MHYEMAEGQDDDADDVDDATAAAAAAAAATDAAAAATADATTDERRARSGRGVRRPRSLFSSSAVLHALRLGRCCIECWNR